MPNKNMRNFAKLFLLYVIALVAAAEEGSTFATCNEQNSQQVLSVINSTVDRLMDLRHPNWGWSNTPEAVLGIQLSAQKNFFGRQNALDAMETEVDHTIDSMNLGKLALYVMAVQASCEDPRAFGGRDLVHILSRRIKGQFYYNGTAQTIPYDRYYRFGLAMGALCVNDVRIPRWLITKLLWGQNEDGSFGDGHSVDDSAQILLALKCLGNEWRPTFIEERIRNAMNKLANFLQSQNNTDGENVWIGNKYSSPSAALALMQASQDSPDDWHCRNVMQSLSVDPQPSDQEGALSQRLPSLSGISYLDLKLTNWQCESPVCIPPGYQPTCNPSNPTTCHPFPPPAGPPIDVRLTIFTDKPPSDSTIPNADVTTTVPEGSTLLVAMTQAQSEGKITFQTTTWSWGESVKSMQGVAADAGAHEYWSLMYGATGEPLPQGVSSYIPVDDEQIMFRLKTW